MRVLAPFLALLLIPGTASLSAAETLHKSSAEQPPGDVPSARSVPGTCSLVGYETVEEFVGLAIPDDDVNGVTTPPLTQFIVPGASILDVVVELELEHTYIGDLVVELSRYDESGAFVASTLLFSRPGVPAIDLFGCTGDFVYPSSPYVFSDRADLDRLDEDLLCAGVIPAGCYRSGSMNPFRGLTFDGGEGYWTLNVADFVAQDTGTLHRWSVHVRFDPPATSCPVQSYLTTQGDVNLVIPDCCPSLVTSTLRFASVPGATIQDVIVGIDLEHGFIGDIDVQLEKRAPGGALVASTDLISRPLFPILEDGCPGALIHDGVDRYSFSDDPDLRDMGNWFQTCPLQSGQSFPRGCYSLPRTPFGSSSFDSFRGTPMDNGDWILTIGDSAPGVDGFLYNWSVHVLTDQQVGAPVVAGTVGPLQPAAPNPFRTSTSIGFVLPRAGPVTLDVFDVRGRRVARIVDRSLPAGPHRVEWPGTDDGGREVAAGTYFVRMEGAGFSETKKVSRLR